MLFAKWIKWLELPPLLGKEMEFSSQTEKINLK